MIFPLTMRKGQICGMVPSFRSGGLGPFLGLGSRLILPHFVDRTAGPNARFRGGEIRLLAGGIHR